ncbi:hypothetical protein M427DRAFT_394926 [Gonapodya prolifera JEL478]|uniref:Uncharacterized protein n=1 Tax=Gonapodya prolifera (strain JEL478) TaxID=1344416 RepID=A0A139A776_GONPJ|nr:hypothetical protein M427DRAFT_394926 [Gonapodya prolifera JEL478]|eukprot:KXS12508.1 hypothetical protein M427DRAFT_394926 [Gonapodya prolifera JEL478]
MHLHAVIAREVPNPQTNPMNSRATKRLLEAQEDRSANQRVGRDSFEALLIVGRVHSQILSCANDKERGRRCLPDGSDTSKASNVTPSSSRLSTTSVVAKTTLSISASLFTLAALTWEEACIHTGWLTMEAEWSRYRGLNRGIRIMSVRRFKQKFHVSIESNAMVRRSVTKNGFDTVWGTCRV